MGGVRAKLLFCLIINPIVFLTFSLLSPSSDLKRSSMIVKQKTVLKRPISRRLLKGNSAVKTVIVQVDLSGPFN